MRCRGELRGAALSPPEAALLEGLAALGFHCSELSRWAGAEALPRPGAPAAARSFYRRALAGGLQEILGAYRAAVLSVEREARGLLGAGAVLPLSALSAELGEFEALLPQLHALVWRVAEGDIRGGALLGLLHEGTRSGAPALRGSLRELFAAAHGVFLRQLAGRTWVERVATPENSTVMGVPQGSARSSASASSSSARSAGEPSSSARHRSGSPVVSAATAAAA